MNLWRGILGLVGVLLSLYAGGASAKPFKGSEIITRETFRYGAFEARIKASEGSGQIMAFFLWKHDSEVPGVGWQEQDFEVFGKNGNFQTQLMTPGQNGEDRTEQGIYHTLPELAYDDYHTYRMEWTPTYLAFYYDGVLIRYEDGTKEPGKTTYKQFFEDADPAQLRINMWAGDWHWSGAFDQSALPGAVFVEHVEVYNYTPNTGPGGSNFSLRWRDDFNTINSNRWWFANWTFSFAVNDYTAQNARAIDGKLVLILTDEANVGKFPTQIPQDDGTVTTFIEPLPPYDPVVIPARLEAEEVSAYQDYSPINFGSPECGRSGVDAELTADSDGYCNLGWVQAGEWTEYKIIVPEAGDYEFVFRASTRFADTHFHLEVDGVNVSGKIGVPQGQWANYNDLVAKVNLAEGPHTLRVVYDTGNMNLNYIDIREAAATPPPVDPNQPVLLPALIEAEAYSGYFDRTIGNQGQASCGTDDVDLQITADTSGVCNIGWVEAGEWTDYEILVPASGNYDVNLRITTAWANVRVHLEVDGVNVSGAINVPRGSWTVFQNISSTVNLSEGQHTLRVVYDTGRINFNYMDIKASNVPEEPPVEPAERFTLPALIEAEDYSANSDTTPGNLGAAICGDGDVDMEITGDVSGGCNIGWVVAGEWVEFLVSSPEAAVYTLNARIASRRTGNRISISVDGNAVGTLDSPANGWQVYSDVPLSLPLAAGDHTIRVTFDTGSVNLNYLNITN